MAALTRVPAARALLLVSLLALSPAGAPRAQTGPADPPAAASAPPAAPPAAQTAAPAEPGATELAAAEAALAQAEYEAVADSARAGLAALDASGGSTTAHRARLLELLALAGYNLGRREAMGTALEQLIRTSPGYRVDASVTGAKFAAELEQRRTKLAGTLVAACTPACDEILIDDVPQVPDAAGQVFVLAGSHRVTLRRRNFSDAHLSALEVPAGALVKAEAQLEQVARDLQLATQPPGARVLLDGREIGVTQPAGDPAGPSRPLVIPSILPGPHALTLQAPCTRRVEQAIDIVLDAQETGEQDLGTIALERAVSLLRIDWIGSGTLAVDGREVTPGTIEVCPGPHEASLTIGGRRVWLQAVESREDETITLSVVPRPTLALGGDGAERPPGFPPRGFNLVTLAEAPAAALEARVVEDLRDAAPIYPAVLRLSIAGIGAEARAAAPEADLIGLVLRAREQLRAGAVLALVDTRRDLVEVSGWTDPAGGQPLAAVLDRPLVTAVPFLGFDVADRAGRPPVIARVFPGGGAASAGLAAGQALLSAAGNPVAGTADFALQSAAWTVGAELAVRVADAGGEKDVKLVPTAAVPAPNPFALRAETGLLLLAQLARAEVLRIAGSATERVAAGIYLGLGLVALGADAEAAAALDRATFDDALDPAGDARATVAFVQEGLLRRLNRPDYAAEVRARWIDLTEARLGGRLGPPLRVVAAVPSD